MTALPTVSARTKLGLEILAFGAAGGLIGDALLRAMPWGLNVALGTAGLVGAGAWLVRRHRITPGPDTAWLAITALLLGAAFVRRDAADLAQFDMLALVGALAFAAASLQGERIMRWSVIDYVRVGVTATIASIVGGLILIGRDIDWREMPREGRLRQLRGVLAGIVIAAPLLVVFAALFAAADQVFANVLQNLLVFDAANIVTHTFFIFFWGALTAGWLRWSLIGRPVAGPKMEYLPPTVTPFVVALGLLNALFLLFVVVQLRYFFGGAALVEQTGGLTYAEYARTGFFQLVTASGLVLPVLLGADFMALRVGVRALDHAPVRDGIHGFLDRRIRVVRVDGAAGHPSPLCVRRAHAGSRGARRPPSPQPGRVHREDESPPSCGRASLRCEVRADAGWGCGAAAARRAPSARCGGPLHRRARSGGPLGQRGVRLAHLELESRARPGTRPPSGRRLESVVSDQTRGAAQ